MVREIEASLREEMRRTRSLDEKLKEAMEYSLYAGGKRLRPVLLMAAADAINKSGKKYLQVAIALEMIHTYSLIHDDLPAMDNDDYRRGKLTNHKVFGEAMAILAGDALLTLAFEVALRQKNVPSEILLKVLYEISMAAGVAGMVGGQAIDLQSEGVRIELSKLRLMHMGKTGALIRAAVRCGGILAGADEEKLAALTRYAEAFGLAFQITDDILDVLGDEKILGKATGSDAKNNKSTYVTLSSLGEAKYLAELAVEEGLNALSDFGSEAAQLRELISSLLSRKK